MENNSCLTRGKNGSAGIGVFRGQTADFGGSCNSEFPPTYSILVKYLRWLLLFVLACSCTKKQNSGDKILYVQSRELVRSLDPVLANDIYSQRMVLQIYEGLLHFHYLKRPLTLEPLLAEAMPTISSDGKVIVFKIKKGVRFQDDAAFPHGKGREITAEDFIYSWKRLADPANKSENYWVFRDKIVGYDEWRESIAQGKADYSTPIEGLQALDPHTLKITLKAPNYQILYQFATAAAVVVPKEIVTAYGPEFFSHAVGTGPYHVKEWIRGSKIIFEKNRSYRVEKYPDEGEATDEANGLLESSGENLPLVDRVVVYEIVEEQPQWLLFQKRELDLWHVTKDYVGQIVANGKLLPHLESKKIQLSLPVSPDITYVGFNTENPFLKNKKLRQAMAIAYNQDTVLKKFYFSMVVRAHGPIPPGFDGYRAGLKNPYQTHSLQKAKDLIREAGYPDGKGLPVFRFEMPSTNTTARMMAEFFKEQMLLIGVNIQIQPNTWPQFNEKVKGKKADIFEMAWNADYPDAENFLQLFYSKNVSPGPNSSNYSSPEFDALFDKALKLPPGSERTALYEKMEERLIEDMPWIYNFHRTFVWVKQPWLRNHKHDQMVMDIYKYLDVDLESKKRYSKDTL